MSSASGAGRPDRAGLLRRLVPPTRLSRRLAGTSVLFASGDGTFATSSAVFLTQVVGLSAAQVGLALTIAGTAQLVLAYPTGRLVDRVGTHRAWMSAAFLRSGCFVALPFVSGFGEYVALALTFAVLDVAGKAGQRAYVIEVLQPEERIRTQAYMYSALNLGFTLGALLGGVALATGDLDVIRWAPLFSVVLLLANAVSIARLPRVPAAPAVPAGLAAPVAPPEPRRVGGGRRRAQGPGPLRNRGWMATSFCMGVVWTNQTVLAVVIPLWLVEATDAPHVLLAWLYATNTVMCIVLPAYTSRGVRTIADALRFLRGSSVFFAASCAVTMLSHSTTGLLTVLLVWLGHVAVTGAELGVSATSWALQSELMDPRRRGEYQGVQEVFGGLGSQWAPAVYTFLALQWGVGGWLVIAGVVGAATLAAGPSVHRAKRFADEYWGGLGAPAVRGDVAEKPSTPEARTV